VIFAPRVCGRLAPRAWRVYRTELHDFFAFLSVAGFGERADAEVLSQPLVTRRFLLLDGAIVDLHTNELTPTHFRYTIANAQNVASVEAALLLTPYFASGEIA